MASWFAAGDPGVARHAAGAPQGRWDYLGSTSVKMSVSPIPVRAIAVFRPSVQTG